MVTSHQDTTSWWYYFVRNLACHFFNHAFDTEATYQTPIPKSGPLLIVSNHLSFLDPPIVSAFIPRSVYFVARKTLFKNSLFGHLITSLHAFPIDQENPDIASLRRILQHLRENHAVLLFPEGARSKTGHPSSPQPGIGWIASKADVPILPVKIHGTYEALPAGARFIRYHPLRVSYGTPTRIPPQLCSSKSKDAYIKIAEYLMEQIHALP
jgi:1-acyl-sn-glycerol-3-phosphate acyltransferase